MKIILEIFGWLQIVAGTTIVAALLAGLVYWQWPGGAGKIIALSLIAVGFIAGAIWATIIWRKYGTIAWLSGIRKIS